jgi:hypothetical protein
MSNNNPNTAENNRAVLSDADFNGGTFTPEPFELTPEMREAILFGL